MKIRIYNGLKREFSADVAQASGFSGIADEVWMKLANAISDAAMDIVQDIHNDAQVVPGIPIGGPFSTTIGPGKIE